jgi:glycine oxidase
MTATPDVVVVGGGPIGMAIAWKAAEQGMRATVVDPDPGSGAAAAAAGMLAPVTEAHFGEEALLRLNLDSAARWPAFAAEVEAAAGLSVGFRTGGTVVVALDADDHAWLTQLFEFQRSLGLDVTRLRAAEVRAREPGVHPAVRSGMIAAGENRVDPRALTAALAAAAARAGAEIVQDRAVAVDCDATRVTAVRTAGGATITAPIVVLAAGCWSGTIAGLPDAARPPVRPVKGQILTLQGPPVTTASVRGQVHGSGIYLVPRDDGRLVVGATVEDRGWDTTVTAGATYELLRDAAAIVPEVSELALVETRAGLRPGSPDNAPLIGRGALDGLVVATGHFRNGILLTPVTADAIVDLLVRGALPDAVTPFDPCRFATTGAPA